MSAPVLVVEDDPTTSDVVRAYLEREGFAVLIARTGRQALDLARQTPPRLIILDIMIPEGDGFEVAQHVRGRGSVAGQSSNRNQGRWKVDAGMLHLSQDGLNWAPQQLQVTQNSNGYPIIKSGGKEYMQCN